MSKKPLFIPNRTVRGGLVKGGVCLIQLISRKVSMFWLLRLGHAGLCRLILTSCSHMYVFTAWISTDEQGFTPNYRI